MAQELIDISGKKYGKLTVISFHHIGNRRRSYWLCECECGNRVVLRKDSFAYKSSKQKSCGCLHRKNSKERITKINKNPNIQQKIRKYECKYNINGVCTNIKSNKIADLVTYDYCRKCKHNSEREMKNA